MAEPVEMIGRSEPMVKLRQDLQACARSDISVLLIGETGSGKEVAARYLHEHSLRSDKSFLPVNLGCMNKELILSELFGHRKGSFTGAIADHEGFFAQAGQGTLLLDELALLPYEQQSVLLRAIDTREYTPLGSRKPLQFEARFVFATNEDLSKNVRDGTFRRDLYYRVAVAELEIPPLRSRKEDIPYLVNHFLKTDPEMRMRECRFSEGALDALYSHDWPGNIRELQNVIQRTVIMMRDDSDVILPEHVRIPDTSQEKPDIPGCAERLALLDYKKTMRIVKGYSTYLIARSAFRCSAGNNSLASRGIGIDRSYLKILLGSRPEACSISEYRRILYDLLDAASDDQPT